MSMWQALTEAMPPKATLTEEHLPDLSGRVYIITGGASGVGLELARLLYSKNARVYIAGRSADSFHKAVENIKAKPSAGTSGPYRGDLVFMQLDLSDLSTIKPAADEFLRKEKLLYSIWFNAGVMIPPQGAKTTQGYDLSWGTNVVAHFLLQKLLTPILISSARQLPPDSVRTIWVSSSANMMSPSPGGINWDDINNTSNSMAPWRNYGQSKAGNIILGHETARRLGPSHGIVSVALNPGNLKSGLQRHMPRLQLFLANRIMYEPRYGALTELFAGFSDQLSASSPSPSSSSSTDDNNKKKTTTTNGAYIIPWGRIGQPRADIRDALDQGTTGPRLWDLLEKEVEPWI